MSLGKRAFSLLELLMVMAILGLLCALLLPALGRARVKTQLTSCASQIRQISIACAAYSHDNRDFLPPMTYQVGTNMIHGNWAWDMPRRTAAALDHYGAGRKILCCPTLPENGTFEAWNYRPTYCVIGYVLATEGCPGVDPVNTVCRTTDISRKTGDPLVGTVVDETPIAPESTVTICDVIISAGKSESERTMNNYRSIRGGYSWKGRMVEHRTAHLVKETPEFGNAAFLDGHVARPSFDAMRPRCSGGPYFWW
jgi:prepilin-type N-terminal cleavage/methylation domain-containing protein/prepilin-type processing-associated H-X9-DG protein